jgi:hypothetical protein
MTSEHPLYSAMSRTPSFGQIKKQMKWYLHYIKIININKAQYIYIYIILGMFT